MHRAVSVCLVGMLALCGSRVAAAKITWESSFAAAQEKARATGKPIMVDFWADWCGWCHELDRTTYVDEQVVNLARSFVAVKVNTEGDRSDLAVAMRFRVDSLPTILFLTPESRVIVRLHGFQRPATFARVLKRVHELAVEVMGWEHAVKNTTADAAALVRLGMHLLDQEDYEGSVELLERAHARGNALSIVERKRICAVLGALWGAERRYNEAETLLKEGLALTPSDAEADSRALYTLGRVYLDWGRDQEARATLTRLIDKHPNTSAATLAQRLLAHLGPAS